MRRSLKEDKRLIAERRGVQELRFSKWTVSAGRLGKQKLGMGWMTEGSEADAFTHRTASRASPRTWPRPMPLPLSRALRPVVRLRLDRGMMG